MASAVRAPYSTFTNLQDASREVSGSARRGAGQAINAHSASMSLVHMRTMESMSEMETWSSVTLPTFWTWSCAHPRGVSRRAHTVHPREAAHAHQQETAINRAGDQEHDKEQGPHSATGASHLPRKVAQDAHGYLADEGVHQDTHRELVLPAAAPAPLRISGEWCQPCVAQRRRACAANAAASYHCVGDDDFVDVRGEHDHEAEDYEEPGKGQVSWRETPESAADCGINAHQCTLTRASESRWCRSRPGWGAVSLLSEQTARSGQRVAARTHFHEAGDVEHVEYDLAHHGDTHDAGLSQSLLQHGESQAAMAAIAAPEVTDRMPDNHEAAHDARDAGGEEQL